MLIYCYSYVFNFNINSNDGRTKEKDNFINTRVIPFESRGEKNDKYILTAVYVLFTTGG